MTSVGLQHAVMPGSRSVCSIVSSGRDDLEEIAFSAGIWEAGKRKAHETADAQGMSISNL